MSGTTTVLVFVPVLRATKTSEESGWEISPSRSSKLEDEERLSKRRQIGVEVGSRFGGNRERTLENKD